VGVAVRALVGRSVRAQVERVVSVGGAARREALEERLVLVEGDARRGVTGLDVDQAGLEAGRIHHGLDLPGDVDELDRRPGGHPQRSGRATSPAWLGAHATRIAERLASTGSSRPATRASRGRSGGTQVGELRIR
jgi:hypothetical protein